MLGLGLSRVRIRVALLAVIRFRFVLIGASICYFFDTSNRGCMNVDGKICKNKSWRYCYAGE